MELLLSMTIFHLCSHGPEIRGRRPGINRQDAMGAKGGAGSGERKGAKGRTSDNGPQITDYGPRDYGPRDYGPRDYGPRTTDHGPRDYGNFGICPQMAQIKKSAGNAEG